MKKVTSGASAQTLENDRPWHRADSGAEPDGEKDVPDKSQMQKGKNAPGDHADFG